MVLLKCSKDSSGKKTIQRIAVYQIRRKSIQNDHIAALEIMIKRSKVIFFNHISLKMQVLLKKI